MFPINKPPTLMNVVELDDVLNRWPPLLKEAEAQAALARDIQPVKPAIVQAHSDRERRIKPTTAKQHWVLAEWYIQHQLYGMTTFLNVVEVDPHRRGGIPVLRGTRFTVAELLAELSETQGVDDVADRFDLDPEMIRDLLNGLSLLLRQPYPK